MPEKQGMQNHQDETRKKTIHTPAAIHTEFHSGDVANLTLRPSLWLSLQLNRRLGRNTRGKWYHPSAESVLVVSPCGEKEGERAGENSQPGQAGTEQVPHTRKQPLVVTGPSNIATRPLPTAHPPPPQCTPHRYSQARRYRPLTGGRLRKRTFSA